MLKIVSGKLHTYEGDEEKIKLPSDYSQLIFVTGGFAFFNKQRVDRFEGYFVYPGTEISVKTPQSIPCSFFCFELDGAKQNVSQSQLEKIGLDSSANVFSMLSPERSAAILGALCGDEYEGHSEDFDQATALLLLSLINPSKNARAYGNPYVDGAVKYIYANIDKEIRVEELALMLGTDRMYLRNLFVKHTGVSTMEFIMNTRIERAKELLKNQRLSVKEVAARVGYSDVLCFSKAFKKHVGASPSEHRDSIRTASERKNSARQQVPVYIL